jgi:hypothetical protein
MRIFDLGANRADGTWAVFGFKNSLIVPLGWSNHEAFFDAHPHIAIERDLEYRSKKAKLPDYTDFMGQSIFSERARTVFAPRLEGLGRWVKLDFEEARYSLFLLTNVVDALDETESSVLRFTDNEKVMRISKYAFRRPALDGQFLFTLPQQVRSDRLVTEQFVDLVYKHQLTGFSFLPLWSEETGSEQLEGVPDYNKPYFTGLEKR